MSKDLEGETQVLNKTSAVTTTVETSNGVGSVSKDSRLWGVSVMAWTLLMITITVCYCQLFSIPLYDHMVNLSLMIVSFYAGGKTANNK